MKNLLVLLLLSIGTIVHAQKVTVKKEVVYRDEAPYCRMVKIGSSAFAPRFSFQTLDGTEFAVAQNKPEIGYVFYFTALDTLIPVQASIPIANSLATMVVQHDLLANGAPDAKALKRFAMLEGKPASQHSSVADGAIQDLSRGLDNLFGGRTNASGSASATSSRGPMVVTGDQIIQQGKTIGSYTVNRYSAEGKAYKTIRVQDATGRTVAEADLLVFDVRTATLRLPEDHKAVELPVSGFPETKQVEEIAQYLQLHSYL